MTSPAQSVGPEVLDKLLDLDGGRPSDGFDDVLGPPVVQVEVPLPELSIWELLHEDLVHCSLRILKSANHPGIDETGGDDRASSQRESPYGYSSFAWLELVPPIFPDSPFRAM